MVHLSPCVLYALNSRTLGCLQIIVFVAFVRDKVVAPPATHLDVILYSREQIKKENAGASNSFDFCFFIKFLWLIISSS